MIDLEAEWARVRTTPSDIVDHLVYMHALAVGMNAQRIIELGVRHGTSTVAWLHALNLTGGHLWSVDINLPPLGLGVGTSWHFIQGDDMDPDIRAQLPTDADIVFIDTDHLYGHTVLELEAYSKHVKPGGVIVLHDTELEWSPFDSAHTVRYPVRQAIQDWAGERDVEWRSGCYGLAVIHV